MMLNRNVLCELQRENTAGEISGASEGKNENFPLMKHVVLECCQIL